MAAFKAALAGVAIFASIAPSAVKGAQPRADAAPASRIFYVVESGLGSWTFIDPKQVELVGGGTTARAWSIRVVRNIMAAPPAQPGYVRTLTDYDCARREFRWREFTAYSRSGDQLLSRQNPAYSWEDARKSPSAEVEFEVVCGKGVGRGVVAAESAAKLVILIMASWDPTPVPMAPKPPPRPKPGKGSAAPPAPKA